jgi:hypothetical protein
VSHPPGTKIKSNYAALAAAEILFYLQNRQKPARGIASRGAVEPWSRGAVEPWSRGAVEPWSRGDNNPASCGCQADLTWFFPETFPQKPLLICKKLSNLCESLPCFVFYYKL